MSDRITLWDPRGDVSSDEAGTTILKYSCPPTNAKAPYELEEKTNLGKTILYVPSLQSLCIKKLVEFPEQVHTLGPARLLYEPPKERGDHDILREVIPTFLHNSEGDPPPCSTSLSTVDPRLWAVLAQVYTNLPKWFQTYSLPLADKHLTLLQQIPSTPYFSLITVLDLPHCADLNDNTIIRLRDLHNLGALDISHSKITSWGVKAFAMTLREEDSSANEDFRRRLGPWRLRILDLRHCRKLEDDVFDGLRKFPLLSVVDLRFTRCTVASYSNTSFVPCRYGKLFHPTPLLRSLDELSSIGNDGNSPSRQSVFSHDKPFFLYVASQYHSETQDIRCDRSYMPFPPPHLNRPRTPTEIDELPSEVPEDPFADVRNRVASIEAQRHATNAAALAFYATPTSAPRNSRAARYAKGRRNAPSPSVVLQIRRDSEYDPATILDIASPLALFRPPPPWQTLSSDRAEPALRRYKRARTSLEDDKLFPARQDDSAVKSLLQRDGAAMIRSEFQKDKEERRKSAIRSNPFAKGMPVSVFEEERQKTSSPSAASTTSSPSTSATKATSSKLITPTRPSLDETESESLFRPSTLPIPPRSTKPLRPISSLPIPQLPPEVLAKLKAESSSSRQASPARKSPSVKQHGVQMKLSDFVKSRATTSSSLRGSSSTSFECDKEPAKASNPFATGGFRKSSSKDELQGRTGSRLDASKQTRKR